MPGRGERTRRRLLDAAATVFAKRGYHAARVDDIVKVARASHGTFYLYFENKEEVFGAITSEIATRMTELADRFPAFGPGDDGREELRRWLDEFAALYRSAAPVLRAWTAAEMAGDAVGRSGVEALARFMVAIEDRFRSAPTEGVDPRAAALAVVAMIERAYYYLVAEQVAMDPDELTATLARVTHHAVHG
jgi:AcrR family transcriptional regulator